MASLADKNLPQAAQDEINRITAEAQKTGNWADANKAANAVREQYGANYSVSSSGTTTYHDDGSTISSLASGSTASGGTAKDYLDNWNSTSLSTDASDYSVVGSPSSFGGVLATIERNPAYANKSVKMGNYTVTFNELGQAVSARQDGGASATSTVNATHADDTAYHYAAYLAGLSGDWNLAGSYMNKIAELLPQNSNGDTDLTAMQLYHQELQNALKYDDTAYYNKLYDEAYGKGSAAAWDATGGAIKTYAQLVDAVGADKAQQLVAQYSTTGSPSLSYDQLGGMNSASGTGTISGLGSLSGTGVQSVYGEANGMMQYLENMYAQNLEAELAALKSAYDRNVAELESQNDQIAEQFRAARNQAAAQNALETQSFNERALASGLNTGASGQMALAQSAAYQGNLGNLWAQEAQQQAESDRLLAEMMRDYNAGVNQVTAAINAQKAQAMYNELIRQQELAYAQAQAQLEQEWLERQFAYQAEQDALNYQLQLMQLEQKAKKSSNSSSSNTQNYAGLYAAALQSGYPQSFISNNYKSYGFSSATGLYDGYEDWLDANEPKNQTAQLNQEYLKNNESTIKKLSSLENSPYGSRYNVILNLVQAKHQQGATVSELADTISKALKDGDITEAGADTLLGALGY